LKPNSAAFSHGGFAAHRQERGADERRSLAVTIALRGLRAYKLLISPYFRGSCRFLPSCADYAAEAFRVHGFWQGLWLSVRRLARCHPLCAAGHDPVPPRPLPHGLAERS
jgi:putative membrane protein insertion efficiency factor